MAIRIIVTGGTLDKIHDPIGEVLTFSGESHVPKILQDCNVADVQVQELMLRDSLELSRDEQVKIAEAVISAPEDRIVITHGTSRMAETAAYLSEVVTTKIVVLTGALRPYSFFPAEPAFNVGCAIGVAQLAAVGVYVVMNGRIFGGEAVRKDPRTGTFSEQRAVS
ncbi:MAG: asparaginase domain-containing protein [Defluviicoccus sp.]|nr:asparaginase domain-containing protein [Defluviicoccus sp.]MDG4591074.1 asparaginase domain-containing protein [Defluviicoccus sp.]